MGRRELEFVGDGSWFRLLLMIDATRMPSRRREQDRIMAVFKGPQNVWGVVVCGLRLHMCHGARLARASAAAVCMPWASAGVNGRSPSNSRTNGDAAHSKLECCH
jgi:hypothetical protein